MTRYKSAVQKRNTAVLLRKPGRLASQYAFPAICQKLMTKKLVIIPKNQLLAEKSTKNHSRSAFFLIGFTFLS